MEYYYGFEGEVPEIMHGMAGGVATGALGLVLGIFLIIYFLALGLSVASYVLGSVGMYRIAKRRGIHHAWLAWIPVGNTWLLGSISDHYQYVVKHKVTKRRTILLVLNLVTLCAGGIMGAGIAAAVVAAEAGGGVFAIALVFIGWLAMMVVAIAATVFSYIAYYDLFQSCRPGNSVLFLVLGILFNVAVPFFVFACGNHDQGMPARRAPQNEANDPAYQTQALPEEEQIPTVEGEIVEDPE